MLHRRHLLAAALLSLSCSAAPPPAPPSGHAGAAPPPTSPSAAAAPAPAPAPAPEPPGLRLPRTASPVRHRATLTIIPGEAAFQGEIEIDLALAEPTALLWLNAQDLTVSQVDFEAGGKKIPARAIPSGEDHLGIALDAPAPAGSAKVRIAYRGEISAKDDHGVFVEEEGGAKYVFTQFESIAARRAFPCFDEPAFKVPWQLSLRVPKDLVALSNTPVTAQEVAGDGMKLVRFAETKPLPSYLVAFTVGPWELVDAGQAGKGSTAVRIAVPRGRTAEARWAKAATPALLKVLEDQIGIPYPYEKLDVVPIPRLATFGAMENPGLITYVMTSALAKPEEETPAWKRGFARTMAHELGHQWFGNLVTTAFWDDIWLNESFAEWVSSRAVAAWQPKWDEEIEQGRATGWAMEQDTLVTARKIRQEISSKDDIQNAFDAITYAKGAAVLSMFDAWLGPERFMKGVRRYLERHAHKAATSADFFAAFGEEAGQEAAGALASFVDQPGVPLVRAELACVKGAPPRIKLAQERLLPVGSPGAAPQTWKIPVCFRAEGERGADGRTCSLLSQPAAEVRVGSGVRCPQWLTLHAGGNGYFHAAYPKDTLQALLGKGASKISLIERVTVLRDVAALVDAGRMPIGDALALVPKLGKDKDPQVLQAALGIAGSVRQSHLAEAQRPAFARFVRDAFGPRARALGLRPKKGEDERIRLIRPWLTWVAAVRGEEPSLVAEAKKLAARWLDDATALEPEAVETVLAIAARNGDRALFDRLRKEARAAKDQKRRNQLIGALGGFQDPALIREAMSIVLSDELDVRETVWLLYPRSERAVPLAIEFVKQNFDALITRMPAELPGYLPRVGEALCDAAGRADLEAFFKERVGRITGGPRMLAQTLEGIAVCSALREAQAESLAAFLKGYAGKG